MFISAHSQHNSERCGNNLNVQQINEENMVCTTMELLFSAEKEKKPLQKRHK
jgi:hypothetical protein